MCACVLKLCLTLCNPMHCSLIGFSVHGIAQAKILALARRDRELWEGRGHPEEAEWGLIPGAASAEPGVPGSGRPGVSTENLEPGAGRRRLGVIWLLLLAGTRVAGPWCLSYRSPGCSSSRRGPSPAPSPPPPWR